MSRSVTHSNKFYIARITLNRSINDAMPMNYIQFQLKFCHEMSCHCLETVKDPRHTHDMISTDKNVLRVFPAPEISYQNERSFEM